MKLPDYNNRLRVLVATYVTFSPDGTELLVNMGGEQVALLRMRISRVQLFLFSYINSFCLFCFFRSICLT